MLGLDRQISGKTAMRVRFAAPLFVTRRRLHLIGRRVAPHLPPRRRNYCSTRSSSLGAISNPSAYARRVDRVRIAHDVLLSPQPAPVALRITGAP